MTTFRSGNAPNPQNPSVFQPRLSVETFVGIEKPTGFLQIHRNEKKFQIGAITSPEYKLVRCLFNPLNSDSAKYNPVTQTLERAFLSLQKRSFEEGLESSADFERKEEKVRSKVYATARNLQRTAAGRFLKFKWTQENIHMAIVESVSR